MLFAGIEKEEIIMSKFIFFSLFLMFLIGCKDDSTTSKPHTIDYTDVDAFAASVNSVMSSANQEFALASFKQLADIEPDNENLFCSPLSLSIALALAYNGSMGTTMDSMKVGMNLGYLELEDVNKQFRNVIYSLQSCDESIQLNTANSLWIDSIFMGDEDFKSRLSEFFLADVFRKTMSSPQTVEEINNWISERTNEKIMEMFKSGELDQLMLLLVNTLYFQGNWTEMFDEELTGETRFYFEDGSSKTLQMMENSSNIYNTIYDETFQMIRNP